jgi:hypothetical protein
VRVSWSRFWTGWTSRTTGDAYEIYRQTRATVREFGLGAGYIEYDLDREQDRGPIRFQGTLRPGYHWPPGEDAGAQ